TKMAGVEVLEAKTFIAPTNASTNANNISQAILKSQQISSAAAAQSSEPLNQTAQPKALNTLKIQLNPAELGVVTATMKLNGDNLQVQLRVENIDAYRMLSEDSSSIVKALKGQGFGIDQINLTLASSDRGSNQQGNPQNGQSFQSYTDQEQMSNQSGNDRNKGSETSNGSDTMAPGNELAQQESVQKDNYSSGVYL
ncbi:MAG: flagellar hook-length control protein FliK, partial [Lentilitoribacter sp.]